MGLKERFGRFNKKGFEWELSSVIIAVVVLVILGAAVIFLFNGKGGQILTGIKNMLHFGRSA